eukprot:CAMPEP_0172187862 /NCGR_PEP_ID=MMETSP1050-20130122/21585_1 /TAXON_ID=233186 /ORGANISM="Cryptomonas curvata, Strain CCAP979/52" /LENGTH=94 /DNA_ID=CAMNT_0012862255 /DNA_START=540 /DNA_END=821 /DNA_ORIENTATION=-
MLNESRYLSQQSARQDPSDLSRGCLLWTSMHLAKHLWVIDDTSSLMYLAFNCFSTLDLSMSTLESAKLESDPLSSLDDGADFLPKPSHASAMQG